MVGFSDCSTELHLIIPRCRVQVDHDKLFIARELIKVNSICIFWGTQTVRGRLMGRFKNLVTVAFGLTYLAEPEQKPLHMLNCINIVD